MSAADVVVVATAVSAVAAIAAVVIAVLAHRRAGRALAAADREATAAEEAVGESRRSADAAEAAASAAQRSADAGDALAQIEAERHHRARQPLVTATYVELAPAGGVARNRVVLQNDEPRSFDAAYVTLLGSGRLPVRQLDDLADAGPRLVDTGEELELGELPRDDALVLGVHLNRDPDGRPWGGTARLRLRLVEGTEEWTITLEVEVPRPPTVRVLT